MNLESFFICNQGGGCFLGNFFRIGLAIVVAAAIVIVIPRTTIVCSASWGASSSDEFFIYILNFVGRKRIQKKNEFFRNFIIIFERDTKTENHY